MFYYIANLLIVLIAAYIAQRGRASSVTVKVTMGIAFFSMVTLAAIRDDIVGTDTRDYIIIFGRTHAVSLQEALTGNVEVGYLVLNWLVGCISTEFYVLFAVIAIIVVGCYQRVILRYAVNYEIAFLAFITMGTYTFFFNGARQGIAAAIGALAIPFLLERRLYAYGACIIFASLFHVSALILLPAYFLAHGHNTLKRNAQIAVAGIVLALGFNALVSIASGFDERYETYSVAGVGGGFVTVSILVIFALFLLWNKHFIVRHEALYHTFLNMYLMGVMIAVVAVAAGVNPSGLLRLSVYFTWTLALIWPIVFVNITDRPRRHLIFFLFYCGSVTYYLLLLYSFSSMLPYQFNPDIFS